MLSQLFEITSVAAVARERAAPPQRLATHDGFRQQLTASKPAAGSPTQDAAASNSTDSVSSNDASHRPDDESERDASSSGGVTNVESRGAQGSSASRVEAADETSGGDKELASAPEEGAASTGALAVAAQPETASAVKARGEATLDGPPPEGAAGSTPIARNRQRAPRGEAIDPESQPQPPSPKQAAQQELADIETQTPQADASLDAAKVTETVEPIAGAESGVFDRTQARSSRAAVARPSAPSQASAPASNLEANERSLASERRGETGVVASEKEAAATTEIEVVDGRQADGESLRRAPQSPRGDMVQEGPRAFSLESRGSAVERLPSGMNDLERTRLVQRVARAFRHVDAEGGSVRIRLSPPELGSLRIELSVHGGVLAARLETENAVTRTLLLENLPALRERLAEQQIRVERFEVDLSQRDVDASRRDGGGSGHEWSDSQSSRVWPRPASRSSRSATGDKVDEAAAMPRQRLTPGRFNVLV